MNQQHALTPIFSQYHITQDDAVIINNGKPYLKDLALGEVTGHARPAKMRELIGRHADAGNLNDFKVLPTKGSAENGAGRPSSAYYLSEEDTLFCISKAETPRANQVLRVLIRFWLDFHNGSGFEDCRARSMTDTLFAIQAQAARAGHSADFLPRLVHLRRAGLSGDEIGLVLHKSKSTINAWTNLLTEAGVDLPRPGKSCLTMGASLPTRAQRRAAAKSRQLKLPEAQA